MARFSHGKDGIATGAVVGTWTSLLGLKAGAAERGRVRRLRVSCGGEAPQDVQVSVRLIRTDNSADGTATAQTPAEKDSQGPASAMDGKHTYTVEPTALESTPVFVGSLNARGVLDVVWPDEDAPVFGPSQTMLLQATPGTAVAVKCDCLLEYDE